MKAKKNTHCRYFLFKQVPIKFKPNSDSYLGRSPLPPKTTLPQHYILLEIFFLTYKSSEIEQPLSTYLHCNHVTTYKPENHYAAVIF